MKFKKYKKLIRTKLKKRTKKISSLSLAMLMIFSSLQIVNIKDVNAVSLYPESTLTVTRGLQVNLGNTALNETHAYIYNMTMGGQTGFCLDVGKTATSGTKYARTATKTNSTYNRIYNYALNNEKINHYLESTPGKWSNNNRAAAQALIWCYEEGLSIKQSGVVLYNVISAIWSGIAAAPDWVLEEWATEAFSYSDASGTLYIYSSGISNRQRILTTNRGNPVALPVDDVKSTQSYTAKESVEIQLKKTDNRTNAGLSDTTFDFYRDNVLLGTKTTNADGVASISYTQDHTKSATVSTTYYEGYDDLSLPNKELVGDVDFSSYAEAKAYCDSEATKKAKALAEAEVNKTHTYKAIETKTKNEYYLNPSNNSSTQSITGNGTVSLSLTNARQEGRITVTKRDSETNQTIQNAIYKLYAKNPISHPDGKTGIVYNANDLVATLPATNANGQATVSGLYLGSYYLKEYQAPNGYLINTATYDVSLTYAGQNVAVTDSSATAYDTVVRGQVSFNKKDKEIHNGSQNSDIVDANDNGAQGDATLEGAVYGIYARNDITHKDGKTGVVTYNQTPGHINEITLLKGSELNVKNTSARAGELLATAKTNSKGEVEFGHLYLGDYYIKEITPSEGYLLDTTQYNVSLTYANQTTALVKAHTDVVEQVKKQAFEIQKFGHKPGQSGVATPLENVEFTVKLKSDVDRMGWDNAPTYTTITTDKNGYGKSIELPFGEYRVKETSTPPNFNTAQDFYVTISEDSRVPQHFSNHTIIDEEFNSLLRIVKIDEDSLKTINIAGATFKIKALSKVSINGNTFEAGEYISYTEWAPFPHVVNSWATNDEGFVILQEKLSTGKYQLEEIKSPEGYLLSENHVEFTVSSDNIYNTEEDIQHEVPVIAVQFKNKAVKGQINLTKEGEVLSSYDEDFKYEVRGLPNAKYEVFAQADIMDPSNDGTILVKKGNVVDTITTNEEGKGTSQKLFLGEYGVREINAPDGMVLNPEVKNVTLKYADENTPIVFESVSYLNERQKVEIDTIKKDSDTLDELSGATFGIYAKTDILNYKGEVIVAKGTKLQEVITDEEGKARFTLDFPLAYNFEVKELNAPLGYASSREVLTYSPEYAGQDKESITLSKDFLNDITKISVSKKDITTQEELPGCLLAVYPVVDGQIQYGEAVDTWYSSTEEHLIKGLEVGKSYILVERNPVDGYTTAINVEFTVEDTGEIQSVEMFNQLTSTKVVKFNEDKQYVEGATLAVYPVDENSEPILGECFDTWVTGKEAHEINGLVVGETYLLRELTTPYENGYVTAKDVLFTVEDSLESQFVYMKDDFTKITIDKVDEETLKNLAGATLAIYPIDDKGEVQYGECFDTWASEDTSHILERIPVGKYLLKELSTVEGYTVANDMIIEVKDTSEIQSYAMVNEFHKVEISKVDKATKDFVEGAILGIYPVDENNEPILGECFETWVTGDKEYRINRLPEGKWAIVELSTPEKTGYIKAEPMIIEVKDTADVQSFTMEDDFTKVEISKSDIVTGEELKDAHLQIIDKETGDIVKDWTTDGNKTLIENVLEPNHDYILREESAPNGYLIAEEIEFTVDETGEIQTVKMKDDFTKVEIMKYTDDKTVLDGAKFEITNAKGEVVATWTSSSEAFRIDKLTVGEEYTIKEVYTPEGYETMKDYTFTVADTDKIQSISLYNTLIPIIDTGDNTSGLAYVAMTMVSGLMIGGIYIHMRKRKEVE